MLTLEDLGVKKREDQKESNTMKSQLSTARKPWKRQIGGLYQVKFHVIY